MTAIKPNRKSTSPTRIGVTLLAGVADDESVLAKLRGTPHIVRLIFILATNERRWRRCIRLPKKTSNDEDNDVDNDDDDNDDDDNDDDDTTTTTTKSRATTPSADGGDVVIVSGDHFLGEGRRLMK